MKIKFLTVLSIAIALFIGACGKSDADLSKAVTEKLAAEKITGVTVAVNLGVATLTGEVTDVTVKSRAEAAAKSVDGIKSVDVTNLRTRPLPVATPAAADPALTGKINEELKKAGCDGAVVSVVNGKPTVTGEVPKAKYTTCIQVINQAGVSGGVDNQLKQGK